jgi:drug/metabolite transporter (DMT)-like permease
LPGPATSTWNIDVSENLPTRRAVALFAIVVIAWGTSWPVTKLIVHSIPPLWTSALRCIIAAVALVPLLWAQGDLVVPKRGDLPVVLSIALLHMVAFSTLVATGLQFVPAGRAIVLGYTTPLWVAAGARIFLSERISRWRAIGIVLGLAGLAVIFNPRSFDWADPGAIIGSGLILLAAMFWAASIVCVRAHKWLSTPFQLVFWELLLAASIVSTTAGLTEGWPRIEWSTRLVLLLLYGSVCGTALAYWAMAMVNRSLPAITTSLGLLATPVVGIISAASALGEPIEASLLLAIALIVGGVAIGTLVDGRAATSAPVKT